MDKPTFVVHAYPVYVHDWRNSETRMKTTLEERAILWELIFWYADQLLYSAVASERPLDPRLAIAGLCGPEIRKLAREREEALTWADAVVAVLPFRKIEPWVQLGYALAFGTHVIVFLAEQAARKPSEHPMRVSPLVAKAHAITNDRQTVIEMRSACFAFGITMCRRSKKP